jgi:hypothetical protein
MDPPQPTFTSINVNSLINNNDNVPSPSNTETPNVKRKRLTQACDACRKKKVKCSGEKPSCNNCTRLGTHCTYLPSTRKRGPRVGLVESLEKRLQQMEKLLQPLKEQKLTMDDDDDDDDDNKPTNYSAKKPRLNPKDSDDNIPFSRFVPPNVPNVPNVTNVTNVPNSNQFQHNFNQQNQPSYEQNNFTNFQLRSQNEQISKSSIEQLMNNEISKGDKQIPGKDDDELIYFGKTAVKPGFRHKSELCGNTGPETPAISESSTTSGSINSEDNTPIVPIHNLPIPRAIVISDYLPIDIVEHLASCFFRYIDIQLSIFHEATFMRQLRQNKVSAFLVLSMCAASAR